MSNSGIEKLKALIEIEKQSLEGYKNKGNAKQAYVDIVNRRIETLVSVYTELKQLMYFEYWRETEYLIEKILEQDPLVGEVMILVGLSEASTKSSLINTRKLI